MRSTPFRGRRLTCALIAGLALTALVAACGGSDSDSNASAGADDGKGPIVIGHIAAKTGRLQVFDGPTAQGLALGVQDINAKGGINGRKVEIKTLDYGSDPARAAAAAQDLLSQKVDFVIAPADQGPGLPVIQAATAKNVPSMGAISGPQATYKSAGPLFWNAYQGTPSEAATLANFSRQKGYGRVFLLEDQILEYTKSFCRFYEESFKELGGTVVGKDTFTSTETQIPAQVARAKSANPDAVVLCSVPPGGVAALKQVRAALPNVALLGDGAFEGVFWQKAVPGLSDWYNVGAVSLNDPAPELQAMLEQFASEFGPPPTAQFPAFGYAMTQLYQAAVEKAGSTETEKVATALNAFKDQPTVLGPTSYAPTCHVPLYRPMVIEGITDGKSEMVERVTPKALAVTEC